MTNEQKYKTAQDRARAFGAWCDSRACDKCEVGDKASGRTYNCPLFWLALEAGDKSIEPCPFCGGATRSNLGHLKAGLIHYWVDCISPDCMYRSAHHTNKAAAIAAHNRVARAVKAAGKAR